METVLIANSYRVELSLNDFKKIIDTDEKNSFEKTLCCRLEKAGCSYIEYDGHFGSCVFFTIDTEIKLETIVNIIKDYIK